MTVQSTSGTELSINNIARLAHIMAGLLEESQVLSPSQNALARDLLATLLADLQADGIVARALSFTSQTLTSGTRSYTLPTSIIDLIGDAAYIGADDSVTAPSSELPVQAISAERWQLLGAKDATGRPTMYFVDRTVTPPVVHLWPIPDEAGTVRFMAHRHLADTSDGAATLDLERYWTGAIITMLAACLAESKGMPDVKVSRLYGKALRLVAKAKAMSNDHVDVQGYVG
jgi:hypothetical protein